MEKENMTEKNLTGYPSIDKPWLKYYSEEALKSEPPKCSVYENIYSSNKDFPNDTALLYFGKKISYRTLFSKIEKAAKAFAHCGVKNGDNIALCMPAVPETIYSVLALNKLGANANLLNPTFSEEQLIERISETGASVLVVINELYDIVKNVIPNTQIKTVISCPAANSLGSVIKRLRKTRDIPNTISWNDFIKSGKNHTYSVAEYRENKPAITVYSSGTTGASKGIQLTNDGINHTITEGVTIGFEWQRGDRWFSQIPVWYSTGICAQVLVPLKYGITIILEPIYDFDVFYRHIIKYKPNFMITACGLLDYLMTKRPKASAYKGFKYLCAGGELVTALSEEKYSQWLKLNGNTYGFFKGYGMCECGGTTTASNPYCNTVGSAGIPTPHVIVSAFDLDSGKELTYGSRGEIRVLTPCRMIGYYKKPEETAKRLFTDENGNVWVRTGDMGCVAEDGNVFVSGRISDSYINSNGETVYLFDIERAVLDIPQVRQCKAVAHEIDGVMTHICHTVLVAGADLEKTLCMIREHCAEKLNAAHQPVLIRLYSDALPVAPSGKLNMSEMQANTDQLIHL